MRNARIVYLWANRHSGWGLLAAAGALFVLALAAVGRGMIHPEAYLFIPHYLNPERSFLQKIFDPRGTDWGYYQARELSYVFDYLDCQVIARSVDHGVPHVLSLSHFLFLGLAATIGWQLARREWRLPGIVAALGVGVFLSTPAVLLGGSFFRSAKAGVVLALSVLVAGILRSRRQPVSGGAWVLLAGTLMGLFDRQGFALLLVGALWLALGIARDRSLKPAALALTAACVAVALYNHAVGPRLIRHFSGIGPSFEFQHLPWDQVRPLAGTLALYSPTLVLDDMRFLFGNVPALAAAALLIGGVWSMARALGSGEPAPKWFAVVWCSLLPLGLLLIKAAMILRLPAMLNLDYRRIYYGLPSVALLWILALGGIALWVRRQPRRARWAALALLTVLLSNLASLVEHRAIAARGMYLEHHRRSPRILAALGRLDSLSVGDLGAPYYPASVNEPVENDGMVRLFQARRVAQKHDQP